MDALEFIPIAEKMQARWWSFPIPASALDGYVKDLANVPAALASAAVDAFSADGSDRPPTSGQIRRRVAELELDAPSWDEVRTALALWRADRPRREALSEAWTCPHKLCDGSGFVTIIGRNAQRNCRCREQRMITVRGWAMLPPLVREFVTGRHVEPEELTRMLERGEGDTEARVRGRWREFVHRAVESRVLAGLPVGVGIARLASARREDAERRERHGELRRFDPAALLPRASE